MRFEERDLTRQVKGYAEPVLPEHLREGQVYFAVVFLDKDGLVPALEPRVFVGAKAEPDGNKLYFQDFVSAVFPAGKVRVDLTVQDLQLERLAVHTHNHLSGIGTNRELTSTSQQYTPFDTVILTPIGPCISTEVRFRENMNTIQVFFSQRSVQVRHREKLRFQTAKLSNRNPPIKECEIGDNY